MASQNLIKLPVNVDNDEQAAVLFSPFRGKNVNPTSWNSKMNFWLNFLHEVALEKRLITIDLSNLPQLFLRKGLTPKCFPTVVEELQRLGKVKSIDDYKRPSSWVSWGFATLVKEPLSWGVSQMFGSPKKMSSVFVWPDVLKKVAEEVLCHLQSSIRQGIISCVVSYSKLEDLCSSIVTTKGHFELVINCLQMDKKIHLEQTVQYGLLVKVCERNKRRVSDIEVTDIQVFEINEARLKIEIELNVMSSRIEELTSEAQGYVKLNKKTMALHCLRKRKHLDKAFNSKSSLLHNLEEILSKIEEAETNMVVVQACEAGLAVLKRMNDQMDIDKVGTVMEEVQEAIQDTEDVNNAIRTIGSMSDEEKVLEEELATLLNEDQKILASKETPFSGPLELPDLSGLSLSDPDFPDVPTHSPSPCKNPPSTRSEAVLFLPT